MLKLSGPVCSWGGCFVVALVAVLLLTGCQAGTGGGSGSGGDGAENEGFEAGAQQQELNPFAGFPAPGAGPGSGMPEDSATTGTAPGEGAGGSQSTVNAPEWYLLAGSVDLGVLAGQFGLPGKRFNELSDMVQTALTDVLDEGERHAFDRAFLDFADFSGPLATGVGFVWQDELFNWHAFGLPAVELTADPYMPLAVAPSGPVIAVSKHTVDAIVDELEPLLADAVSQLMGSMDSSTRSQLYGLIDDLENFAGRMASDDPRDGRVSTRGDFSFTIPDVDYGQGGRLGETRIKASLSYDMEQMGGPGRWLGGIGADISASYVGEYDYSQTLELEMGIGEQRMAGLDVISLEPGPGTTENAARLAGEWTAAIPLGTGLNLLPLPAGGPAAVNADLGQSLGGAGAYKEAQSAASRFTLQNRLAHATGRLLGALGGRTDREDSVRSQSADDTTLYVRLRFDSAGRWEDVALAMGQGYQAPAASEFMGLQQAIDDLGRQLGTSLPAPELRTSLLANGSIRLDIVANDLVLALLQEYARSSGTMGLTIPRLDFPDLSAVIFGGDLAADQISGRAVILLFVQEVTFTRTSGSAPVPQPAPAAGGGSELPAFF